MAPFINVNNQCGPKKNQYSYIPNQNQTQTRTERFFLIVQVFLSVYLIFMYWHLIPATLRYCELTIACLHSSPKLQKKNHTIKLKLLLFFRCFHDSRLLPLYVCLCLYLLLLDCLAAANFYCLFAFFIVHNIYFNKWWLLLIFNYDRESTEKEVGSFETDYENAPETAVYDCNQNGHCQQQICKETKKKKPNRKLYACIR